MILIIINNILNIISFNTNSMETLDLRCNDGWNIIYTPSIIKDGDEDTNDDDNNNNDRDNGKILKSKSLSDLFGIHFIDDTSIKNREDKCRFLRFTDWNDWNDRIDSIKSFDWIQCKKEYCK